ncbi:flagellar biosynthesis protein FlhA [Acidisphaera sp. S103]|uniref:flagellar biosynthesis protein FlhA n=1 Tax=Acidisphaera sp. S103 TaxID=1747223 RepID=UPI0020B13C77|nr:flagellar biosynthesis protein FlhA [Acidisphaera sp. S103]
MGQLWNSLLNTLGPYRRMVPGGDIGLALCVLFQLSILIMPIPTFLLDMALALSFIASILILLISLSLERPLDFSSLPTLLLLTTILRLSLNVATARLILSHGSDGPYAAGHVVAAFGGFLMGGDLVVGAIIFSMLLMVNFVVITKGSSRIAEVAARFYLDAMPGKQMAIDADLSSGIIDEPTARKRRGELSEEAGFYGAMDGASKFVRGDAISALVITLINIFGGLAMGLVRAHMSVESALATYSTLTIGDGLVSQIPALLVSTAAGIVVSKGAIEGKMHGKLAMQLGSHVNPLMIAAAASGVLALLPGLPTMPFLAVSVLAGAAAWHRFNTRNVALAAAVPIVQPPDTSVTGISVLDVVRVELGYGLLELASGMGHQIPEQIKRLRRALATDLGFVLPSVRIQDNVELEPYNYVFALKEISAGNGELRPLMMLAISPGEQAAELPGERTVEPTFGLPACWIAPALADQARSANWTVVDPATVLTTHLAEVVKENIAEFLSYTETQKILSGLPQEQQKLVADLIPSTITVGGLQRVLQMLLAERISIRDMPTILEAVQEACAGNLKSVSSIVAHVRTRLSRQISDSLIGLAGYVPVVVLSPEWEDTLAGSMVGPPDDRQLALGPEKLREFLDRIRVVVDGAVNAGEKPVLLTSMQVRYHVHSIVDRIRINVPVVAQAEIHRRARVKVVGTI